MGRNPIIRKTILSVLGTVKNPLYFGEVKEAVRNLLGRKKIHDGNIDNNLKKLRKEMRVEQVLFKGKIAYRLTEQYYREQAKTTVLSLLHQIDEKTIYTDLKQSDPPFIAFVEPFKPVEEKYTRTTFFDPPLLHWSDVNYVITARMLESFTELNPDIQRGIAKLLAFAYWYGVRHMIEKVYGKGIERSKDFALTCIERAKARGDHKRVEVEKAILSLLDISAELSSISNLKEFLNFLKDKRFDVDKLQSEVLEKMGHFLMAGETIFNSFLKFHSCVMSGFWAADFIPKGRIKGPSNFPSRFLFGFGKVWDSFIGVVFSDFISSGELENIKESPNETLAKIKAYKTYLEPLKSLPFKSKICITYLWGYPEIFQVSDKSFLPLFKDWLVALRNGHLSYHTWLFTEGEKELVKAYRVVKKNMTRSKDKTKAPQPVAIDFVTWTLQDLYLYHPEGKELTFWKKLLDLVRSRKEALTTPV